MVRGVVAAKPFKKGEVIVRIPEKLLVHAFDDRTITLDETKFGADATEPVLVAEKRKGASPFWAPYIDSLPSAEEYAEFLPTFQSMKALEPYKGSLPVVAKIAYRQEKLQQKLKAYRTIDGLSDLSFEEIQWADAAASSRAFMNYDAGRVMVPLADLLLDAPKPNTLWSERMHDGNFVIRAREDIQEGDELTDTYGDRSNEFLFLIYGFVFPNDANTNTVAAKACSKNINTGSNQLGKAFVSNLEKYAREFCVDQSRKEEPEDKLGNMNAQSDIPALVEENV